MTRSRLFNARTACLLVAIVLVVCICAVILPPRTVKAASGCTLYRDEFLAGPSQFIASGSGDGDVTDLNGISSLKCSDRTVKVHLYMEKNFDNAHLDVVLYGEVPKLSGIMMVSGWGAKVTNGGSIAAVFLKKALGLAVAIYGYKAGTTTWNDQTKSARCDLSGWVNDSISSFTLTNAYQGEMVYTYRDSNYGGRCEKFITGDRTLENNYIQDNEMGSLICSGAVNIILYQYKDMEGDSIEFTGPCYIPSLAAYGWNNKASSIQISECNSRGVVFHGDADFGANGNLFFASDTLPTYDWNSGYVNDNAISSVQLVGGACLVTYSGQNYTGTPVDYCSSGPG